MRNTILATMVLFGLSAVAFGATNPSTSAASAAAPAQTATASKPDSRTADCHKQAKEKELKGAEHKKFMAECLKKPNA